VIGREYDYNLKGELQLEKKSDMKKRGLASPDIADALALVRRLDGHGREQCRERVRHFRTRPAAVGTIEATTAEILRAGVGPAARK
jgi:hypothetical protein